MKPDTYFEPFAEAAYEGYKESTGGKTFDGRDMPTWLQIGIKTPHVQLAWIAAVKSTFRLLQVTDANGQLFVEATDEQHQRDLAAKHIIQEGKKPDVD
jgi:hypothetical protein